MRKIQQGFTLIELMIVVAIIGILAAVAIPNYQQYTKKAKFTEVVQATAPFKLAIEACFQDNQNLGSCSTSGTNGIPAAAGASGYVSTVVVGANATITATAISSNGLAGETYILTPTTNGTSTTGYNLTWAKASTSTCATTSNPIC